MGPDSVFRDSRGSPAEHHGLRREPDISLGGTCPDYLDGRHFGREAVERIGEPLLAGIHAGDPDRLSMLSAFPRFVEMERKHGSLIRAMWKAPRPPSNAPAAFVSFPGGLQELADAVAARVRPSARSGLRCRMRPVRPDGDESRAARRSRQRGRPRVPPRLRRACSPPVDAGLAAALGAFARLPPPSSTWATPAPRSPHSLDGSAS